MTDKDRADLLLDILATERKLDEAYRECAAAEKRTHDAYLAARKVAIAVIKDIDKNRDRLWALLPARPDSSPSTATCTINLDRLSVTDYETLGAQISAAVKSGKIRTE